MLSLVRQIKFCPRGLLALCASLFAAYVFLSPLNVPLYNLIMFPCPDPRTPDMNEQFKQLSSHGARKRDVEFRSANGNLIRGWFIYTVPEGGHCCYGTVDEFTTAIREYLNKE